MVAILKYPTLIWTQWQMEGGFKFNNSRPRRQSFSIGNNGKQHLFMLKQWFLIHTFQYGKSKRTFLCFTPLWRQGLSSSLPPSCFQASYAMAWSRTWNPCITFGVGLLLDLLLKSLAFLQYGWFDNNHLWWLT